MKAQYTQALLDVLHDGMPVDTALAGLKNALKKKNHSKLLAPVLLEVVRILEAGKDGNQAVVTYANTAEALVRKAEITETLKALGADETTQIKEVVDETLIGGYVATFNHLEHDQSYRKTLKSLFESITK